VELGRNRLGVDSTAKQRVREEALEDANAVEHGLTCRACNNVAIAVERALEALGRGRIDIAREWLEGLVQASGRG